MLYCEWVEYFAGSHPGVFVSTNNGASWASVNTGLTNAHVLSLTISGTQLFAGTSGGVVWRRPLSEMITAVASDNRGDPGKFLLQQNYPNPFNPTTAISYQLPAVSFVTLKVYDVLGREVVTLVNEKEAPGEYTVQFDASKLASGVYFYRLTTERFTHTRKMLLMK